MGLLASLRSRTSQQHARLDAALGGALTRELYVGLLRASLAVVASIEPALARQLPATAMPRRTERLVADLYALGEPPDVPAAEIAPPASLPASYGAAYVIEGSTLGGMALAPRFERELGLADGQATSYLRLRGGETARRWRSFLDELARVDAAMDDAQRSEACDAAVATFEAYAAQMRRHGVLPS